MKIQDPAVRAQAMRIAASATPPNGEETVTVTVDGRTVEVPAGASILEAAKKAGRRIPTLCHHPDLPDAGVCRVCVVEVSGQRNLQASCAFPITAPVDIQTYSPRVRQQRELRAPGPRRGVRLRHLPVRPHVWQSPQCSASIRSTMSRRAWRTRGLYVWMSTGAVIGNAQLAWRLRWPDTSTTQTRQTPASGRSGWWQSVGIRRPASLAASRMLAPAGTSTVRPSTVTVTVSSPLGGVVLAAMRMA